MKFGTSGLRGLVTDMTDDLVAAYTNAFLQYLADEEDKTRTLLVGRDLRPSSAGISRISLQTANSMGIQAVDCGVLPTPALALEAARQKCPAIMVTGSHIPFDYNGLKFYRPAGEITKADEIGITLALSASNRNDINHSAIKASVPSSLIDTEAVERYVKRAVDFFPHDLLEGKRIGLYEHSAASRDLLVRILENLGATVIQFGRTDGFIPIDTEAVRPEDETLAQEQVSTHRLDAMVSTDGDGDRPLMADETGTILRGDILGLLTARFLNADAVATPISSNSALERTGWFARIKRTRIGSPFVIGAIEALSSEGARLPVGYEANGGFLLGGIASSGSGAKLSPLPTRDAVLPILATLGLAAREGLSLSNLIHSLPQRYTASDRLKEIPQDKSGPFLAALAIDGDMRSNFLRTLGISDVTAIDLQDGVRLSVADDEILHLRASGNAPELRCYAESATTDRARLLVATVLQATSEWLSRQ